jgi:hypothetical protein
MVKMSRLMPLDVEIAFRAAQRAPVMINIQADLLAVATGKSPKPLFCGFWVEDVGSTYPEILGRCVNGAN